MENAPSAIMEDAPSAIMEDAPSVMEYAPSTMEYAPSAIVEKTNERDSPPLQIDPKWYV
jgi:hypothetical protein